MIFTHFLNFNNEFLLFNENFNLKQNFFNNISHLNLIYLNDFSNFNFFYLKKNNNLQHHIITNFISQIENNYLFNNLENIKTIYHYSIPNTKLAYPEPFIASASMMHSDLWFIHILIYQYWLWFVFVFLIIFFFITFICTIRWCNMRIKPRRETRGVSRSKCGDLITATVPVSWATSIIVHESTDAIDYYDGFGTSELVIGIRAYQWGWEYYYPKDIDLNYNIKHNYSTFVGNSLKYNTSTELNLKSNNMWKYYQNKNFDSIVTPAHLLFLPINNFKTLNFLNFNEIGSNALNEPSAFKKIKMFSKTLSNKLINTPNNFNLKYKQFFFLNKNENFYLNSLNLGLKRQHNFLNNFSINNNYSTFFGFKNISKWLNFNFNTFNENFLQTNSLKSLNFFQKNDFKFSTINNLRINNYFNNLKTLQKFLYYPNFIQLINDDSDKKKLNYPIFKINNLINNTNLNNFKTFSQILVKHDLNILNYSQKNDLFNNKETFYKNFSSFSSNQSISTNSKSFRNFLKLTPTTSILNHNLNTNTFANYLNYSNKNNLNDFFLYNLNSSYWIDLELFNKFSTNRVFFDSPYSPITSNNLLTNTLEFDNYKNTFIENNPTILQSKDDQLPFFITTAYWNFYWTNTNVEWRLKNNINYKILHENFYLPFFSFFYDYDFRNWQNLELFEDVFWESTYSIYLLDEYLSLTKNFYNYNFTDKIFNFYNNFNKKYQFKNQAYESIFKSMTVNNEINQFYSNFFYIDEEITTLNLTNTFSYSEIFSNLQNNLEDSYESLKFLNYSYNVNHNFLLLSNFINFTPLVHSHIFNVFKSNYDDFFWFFDDKFFFTNLKLLINKNFNNHELFFLNKQLSFFSFNLENELNYFKSFRLSNYLDLRSPIKNSIVTYNALQKVFHTRFDEGRSNTRLNDYSNSYNKQNYISESRLKYEKLINKNKEFFFNINLYKNNSFEIFNEFYDCYTSLNFYTFDFPFLLAMKSDASRYLWFDWFSKWGFYEVQPSSSSRYAIYGMPYFNKNFEFNAQSGENLTESETYFLRISKIRKNYLPNWSYTPYLYTKTFSWIKNNKTFQSLFFNNFNLNTTEHFFNLMSWYWKENFFNNNNSIHFSPSNSNVNSFSKSFWKPQNNIQSYYYSISILIDILSKREYFYREFLNTNNKIINLPSFMTTSPSNPLINEIKSAFFYYDFLKHNNEYSKNIYYESLNFFNSNLTSINEILNLNNIINFFNKIINFETNDVNKNNQELYKNQYRPMRKGISNMIRLHATGAIAMPIEVKLQILASSKDVIHSWAIPSAGIKIDCVPGYSSHKVTIFLVSGIFWGQCMEICGRYHHWMPIIVYFMKRDLFFLWCTHFVFSSSSSSNIWNINDRQFTNYVQTTCFNKLSWLSEINKI